MYHAGTGSSLDMTGHGEKTDLEQRGSLMTLLTKPPNFPIAHSVPFARESECEPLTATCPQRMSRVVPAGMLKGNLQMDICRCSGKARFPTATGQHSGPRGCCRLAQRIHLGTSHCSVGVYKAFPPMTFGGRFVLVLRQVL